MTNFTEHAQMGSALVSAFNRRETFLNGGTAAAEQKIAPTLLVIWMISTCRNA